MKGVDPTQLQNLRYSRLKIGVTGLAIALLLSPALADTVRVTTWNIAELAPPAGTNELVVPVQLIKQLNPDLILLQGARNWQMCSDLAKALKPAEYYVAVCSAFPASRAPDQSRGELAILTKQKAYFSWSEPWRAPDGTPLPSGFVFAAVQFGRQRVGCFSTAFPAIPPREFSARQLLDQVEVVRRWEANRVEGFLVGGTFTGTLGTSGAKGKVLAPIEAEGFVNVFEALSRGERETLRSPGGGLARADCLLVDSGGMPLSTRVSKFESAGHWPVTCDLELDPLKIAAARTALLAQHSIAGTSSKTATYSEPTAAVGPASWQTLAVRFWWAVALLAGALGISGFLLRRRRFAAHRLPSLIPANFESSAAASSAYTVLIAGGSVTGSAAKPPTPQPLIQLETAGTTHTESAVWQRRALEAERRAEHAQEAIRRGVLPHFRRWLKHKFAKRLLRDRSQLLEAQQAAARKAFAVDERLARIETQIQHQNAAYQRRVDELTCELMAAKEENRELIRARIAQIKLEMEAARAKLMAQAKDEAARES